MDINQSIEATKGVIGKIMSPVGVRISTEHKFEDLAGKHLTYYFQHAGRDPEEDPIEAITVKVIFAHYRPNGQSITLRVQPQMTSSGYELKDNLLTIRDNKVTAAFVKDEEQKAVYGSFGNPLPE